MTRMIRLASALAIVAIAASGAAASPATPAAYPLARENSQPHINPWPAAVSQIPTFVVQVPDSSGVRIALTRSCAPAVRTVSAYTIATNLADSNRLTVRALERDPLGYLITGGGGVLFAMGALAAARDTKRKDGRVFSLPMGAAKKVYAGGLVVLNGLYAEAGSAAAGLQAIGRAADTVDNTDGDAGDLNVTVEKGVFLYANSGGGDAITNAHVGRRCFIVDDQTVALTDNGGARSMAGIVREVDAQGVWVDVGGDLAYQAIDGSLVENVADADTVGGVPVVYRIPIADASADTDVIVKHKIRVLRFEFRNTGIAAHAANDTVQLRTAANPITDAVAKTATVNKQVAASTYDPAYETIAAGGTMRVHAVKDTNVEGVAYVTAIRVA